MNILLFHLKNNLKKLILNLMVAMYFRRIGIGAQDVAYLHCCLYCSILYMVLIGSCDSMNAIWPDGSVVCVNEFRSHFKLQDILNQFKAICTE